MQAQMQGQVRVRPRMLRVINKTSLTANLTRSTN
jgi:hypothetical protein